MLRTNKTFIVLFTIAISTFFLTACSLPTAPEELEQIVEQTASQTAKYKIEFIADWRASTHPGYYPSGAHFSPFIAYSHNESKEAMIFTEGEIPSAGVEEMSETGATGILIKEIQSIIDSNFAYKQTKGKRIDSPGNDSSELNFSQDYSHVTFVSMLAPSPDWFVAGSISLFEDGQWLEKSEVELITYDSGGDDGEELTSKDQDSSPKQAVAIFNENLQNLGKIILIKVEE
jgi:hypothetical protein